MSDYRPVHAYSQEVYDLAFTHYILCDRMVGSAMKSLEEAWDEDWGSIPDRKTVERWARLDSWSARADMVIADTYPQLFQRDIARLVAMRSLAISTYARAMMGEVQGRGSLAAIQAARHVLELTAGGMAVGAPNADGGDHELLSPEERVQRQRQRLEKARGARKGNIQKA